MCLVNKLILIAFTFLSIYFEVKADAVPAILWNIQGNSLPIKQVSALEKDDGTFNENLENLINQDVKILVYSMNKLSSEDFLSGDKELASNSTIQNLQNFLDSKPYMFLSSVQDPLSHLHEVHCGVREIVVDQSIDKNILQSVSLAFGQSCIVILHVTNFGIFGAKDPKIEDIENVFLPKFSNAPKDVVGIFTSEKSSWNGLDSEHHFSRNMLQAEEAADSNFINITGCIYMYVENVTVQVGKEKNNTVKLSLPPTTTGSSCGNNTASLVLTFKPSGDITSVVINFNFKNVMGSWVTDATVALSGKNVPEGDLPANAESIEAPMKYSFNCGNLRLKTTNDTNVIVTFKGFQLQPFPVSSSGFSDSFDCIPFFTVPIWMGVFVSLLFIIIINVGVYALFSVHTMDRFDDPKGKTISVAVGGE